MAGRQVGRQARQAVRAGNQAAQAGMQGRHAGQPSADMADQGSHGQSSPGQGRAAMDRQPWADQSFPDIPLDG
eukprot:13798305-Heterocapsa_arctica.AAC.1